MGMYIIDRIGEISYTKNGTPAKIVEYIHKNNVLVEFQDNYKYKYYTKYENFIKQMVDDYKDIITKKVYNALYNYEVLITD